MPCLRRAVVWSRVFRGPALVAAAMISLLLSTVPAAGAAQTSADGTRISADSGRVSIDYGTLAYRVLGEGEPLVVINGGPGWSSRHMLPMARRLATERRVILFDQRGTGGSRVAPLDSTTITLASMVADVEALRRHLGLDRWDVLGHSFGALLATAYAAEHPGRLRSLVLSAPPGADLDFLGWYQASLADRMSPEDRSRMAEWSRPERLAAEPGRASLELIRATLPAFLVDEAAIPDMMAVLDTATWRMDTAQLVWADLFRIGFDLKTRLRGYDGRVLVIQGRQDALGDHRAHTTAALFPNAELVMLDRAAHIMWVDRPDGYFEAVQTFLAGGAVEAGLPIAGSGVGDRKGAEEHQLREAVLAFADAYVAADVETLRQLLTADYVHVNGGSGSVLDRDSWLGWISRRHEDLEAGRLVVDQYEVGDLEIRIHGQTAVVIGSVLARERRGGEELESEVRFTNVWVYGEGGRWRRAAFHDSPLR